MIVLLGGGVGAGRFSKMLATIVPPQRLTCIVNTADDFWHYGLRICPDIDTTLYTHGCWLDERRGWGLKDESFRTMGQVRHLGAEPWFNLGDLDLATHLLRTGWLRDGFTLSQVTGRLAERIGVQPRVLPMTDQWVETCIYTSRGWLSYQQFLVLHDARDEVLQIRYQGLETAQAALGVIEAIEQAEIVIIAPSNPHASIAPILALPGVRQALETTPAPLLAITPIVSGIPIEEPGEAKRARSRAALLDAHNLPHRATSAAYLYRDFVDVFLLDEVDAQEAAQIEALGMQVVLAPTLFHQTSAGRGTIEQLLQHYLAREEAF